MYTHTHPHTHTHTCTREYARSQVVVHIFQKKIIAFMYTHTHTHTHTCTREYARKIVCHGTKESERHSKCHRIRINMCEVWTSAMRIHVWYIKCAKHKPTLQSLCELLPCPGRSYATTWCVSERAGCQVCVHLIVHTHSELFGSMYMYESLCVICTSIYVRIHADILHRLEKLCACKFPLVKYMVTWNY